MILCFYSQSGTQTAGSVLVIAHRGNTGKILPENTIAAFRECINTNINIIEIDLRISSDGHLVVIHDETLERMANIKSRVSDKSLAELKKLDAGKGETIPTYKEILKLILGTGIKLLLDIKTDEPESISKIFEITSAFKASLEIIAGVRSLEHLRRIKQLDPNIRTLGFVHSIDDWQAYRDNGVDIIRLWPQWIKQDPDLVKKIHDTGKPVWSTLNSPSASEYRYLLDKGVNGIITDYPLKLKELIDMEEKHSD
jgi:glycerophosphoryl diester phosphodiesterase